MNSGDRTAYEAAAIDGLQRLAALFGDSAALDATPIEPSELQPPFRELLQHDEHMTLKLRAHHGQPLKLKVLAEQQCGNTYARRIVLTLGPGGRPVEFDLVRIDLDLLPPAVTTAIQKRDTPLGDILVKHDIMRRVEPRWYYRFGSGSSVRKLLQVDDQAWVCGRAGRIYCDEQPAIEVLEVVTA